MPPRTRGVKASKASKENISILHKNKGKTAAKTTKPARKPLADKTNSASDENASPEPVKKVIQSTKSSRKVMPEATDEERPRRNRRLPTRYVENQVLINLSNSKESAITPRKSDAKTSVKDSSMVEARLKTPPNADNILLANRPKRVSRLPLKFDENSESPFKVTIQPCHTSTPLVQKSKVLPKKRTSGKQKGISENESPQKVLKKVTPQKVTQQKVTPPKVISPKAKQQKVTPRKSPLTKVASLKLISRNDKQKILPQKTKPVQTRLVQKKLSEVIKNNTHINIAAKNNEERPRRLRNAVAYKEVTLSPKLKSPENTKPSNTDGKKILKANSSFRVLEDKKTNNGDNLDVYEFTFDPSQEPLPQKKKKKKVTNKKPAKPKTRVFNNNYEKNLARALADLKNTVAKKADNVGITSSVAQTVVSNNNTEQATITQPAVPNPSAVLICTTAEIHSNPDINNSVKSNGANKNHASIRIEDIAADFEPTIDHHDDINYSPVNSPHPNDNTGNVNPDREVIRFDDPLNLQNELSFFDEQPVASSSMNVSTRNPTATPWRVEFENLPIKWQANTYVKPDMTPALESSYINQFDDSKKKHVYTNMVAPDNDPLPDIVESEAPKLKQTSIISFIKEVIEKSASKKKKVTETPKKANHLFDDPITPVKTPNKVVTPRKDTSGSSKQNTSSENDTSAESNKAHKRKNDGDINPTPAKVSRKDKENTLFGFDDSENQQENVSPVKIESKNRLRSLRSRSGAVLRELNKQTGPMRADLPTAMKKMAPSSDAVEKMYDQMKSAADAPVLLDEKQEGVEATNLPEMADERVPIDDDSQSVHLFEDVELVHHLKPTRKSYGTSKKVTFGQHSSDSAELKEPARNSSSDEEDLSFHLPEVKPKKVTKKKKKTKKQLLSKKEKEEVDAWAACFNSMCEDIEEFDLVVE